MAGWYQQFVSGIVTLAVIPKINSQLSPEQGGLWFSFQAILLVLSLTDFGLGFVLSRQIAFSIAGKSRAGTGFEPAQSEWDRIADLAKASDHVFRRVALIAVILLVALYHGALPRTAMAPKLNAETTFAWYALGASAICLLFQKKSNAILDGIGKVYLTRWLSGTYQFFSGLLVIAAMRFEPKMSLMSLSVLITTLSYALLLKHVLRRSGFHQSSNASEAEFRGIRRELWKAAVPMGIVSVSGYCVSAIQVPLIGLIMGPKQVLSFFAAQKIGQMLSAAVSQLCSPQLPLFSMSLARGDWSSARIRMARTVGFVTLTTLLAQACFYLLSPIFANYWLGPGRYAASSIVGILALDYALTGIAVVFGQFVLASGKNPFTVSTLLMGFLNLGACWFFGHFYGLIGIALSGLVAGLLTNYWWLPLCGYRLLTRNGNLHPASP